jgi:hypothetical protein
MTPCDAFPLTRGSSVVNKTLVDEVKGVTNMTVAAGAAASLIAGAVTWFVLDVILGIAVWISFVAGGGVLVLGVALALGAGAGGARTKSHRASPKSPLGAG